MFLAVRPQDGMDASDEFLRIEGLREVIVGPEFKSEDAVSVLTPCREHDHRDGESLSQSAQHVEAVQRRQHHVQDDEIEYFFSEQVQGCLPILSDHNTERLCREVLRQHQVKLAIVVHEQNRCPCHVPIVIPATVKQSLGHRLCHLPGRRRSINFAYLFNLDFMRTWCQSTSIPLDKSSLFLPGRSCLTV